MPATKTAPYGSWKSPITSDLIVAKTTMLSDVRIDGDYVFWLEGRPQEQGRSVIVRTGPDGIVADITPASFSVRTRVHEYGGASWLAVDGTCIFSNFADQRLYLQRAGEAHPEPLTPEPSPASGGGKGGGWRYSDGVLDHRRRRWIGGFDRWTSWWWQRRCYRRRRRRRRRYRRCCLHRQSRRCAPRRNRSYVQAHGAARSQSKVSA